MVKSEETSWSLPSDIDPGIIIHILQYWDKGHQLSRLEKQRTAQAISVGVLKTGFTKWFCINRWIEIFIHKDNPDSLVSRSMEKDIKKREEIKFNLIEYR